MVVAAAAILAGAVVTGAAATQQGAIAVVALGLMALFAWLGRGDWTRPYVILPVPWYGAVALAQLKLTNYEAAWSAKATLLVLVGPLALALGAFVASGGGGERRHLGAFPDDLSASTLRRAALALLGTGIVGLVWRSQLLGGITILSPEIDATRGRALVPAYVTFLTDGFFLGFWASLAAIAVERARQGRLRVGDLLVAALALAGTATNASRNTVLVAVGVPVIFAYLVGGRRVLPARRVALAALVVLAVFSGLFFLRTAQHRDSPFEAYFYSGVVYDAPVALRPLLPVYVALAAPFETLNRLAEAVPDAYPYGRGAYSLVAVPPALSPLERKHLYNVTGPLSAPYYFNVATYEGSLLADGGVLGVIGGSLVLGLAFGLARRRLFREPSLRAAAVYAYLAYTLAFMVYENLYSFYLLSVVYDLLVVAVVVGAAQGGLALRRRGLVPRVAGEGT